jgi:DNA-binding CsgD family transcriptional regulator
LTASGPTVLVLEDLHWADEQTVDFLGYVLADPPQQLVVAATYRGEQVSPAVRALAARLPDRATRAQVALEPLDVQGTGALVAGILGTDEVSDEFASYVWQRTGGLPFAVEEVLALVQSRGLLMLGPDGRWNRRALDELGVPTAIRDSTLERVARLPVACRRVAEAAAVLQTPVSVSTLRQMIAPTGGVDGQTPMGMEAALDAVIRSGLLVDDGGLVGFRHVLAGQAVYEAMSAPAQQTLHGRAATALDAVSPPPRGQIAHHLKNAGRLGEWASAAEHAASQAIELGHEDEAVRLLEDVLRSAPLHPDQRGRVAVMFGRAATETLEEHQAAETLWEVLAQDLPPPVRGELQFWLAVLLNREGADLSRTRDLLIEAVAALGHRSDLRAWAMVSIGLVSPMSVPLAEDLDWLDRSVRLAGEVGDPALEMLVLGKAAAALLQVGDPGWRRLTERVQTVTNASPRLRGEVSAYFSIAFASCLAGYHDTAERLLAMASRAPALRDSRRLEVMLRSESALLAWRRGDWTGLAGEVDRLLAETVDYASMHLEVEIVAGFLALAHGDLDEAERRSQAALAIFDDQATKIPESAVAAACAARVSLARRDVDSALSVVRTFIEPLAASGVWAPMSGALPAAIEVLIAAGQQTQARRLLERAEQQLPHLDAPLGQAALRHALGLLAAAEAEWNDAVDRLTSASDLYGRLPCPYEAAQADELAANCLFEAGDGDRAKTTLRSALVTFQELGASWDADRALELGRRHGVVLAPRHTGGRRGYGTELSPRERQVAELAASGLSNREIGEQLFVSKHTVDRHLRAVFRKLGTHSRAAIASRLVIAADAVDPKDDVVTS